MEKKTVWICVPSYSGRVQMAIADLRQHAAELSYDQTHPFRYETWFNPIGIRGEGHVRNMCVRAALKDPSMVKLMMIDDDMNPPWNWWALLLHRQDVVSGLTCGWTGYREQDKRIPQVTTVMYERQPDGAYVSINRFGHSPFSVDAVGAACLVLSRSLLERIEPPWFKMVRGTDDELLLGEDIYFFQKANSLGTRALVDPRIVFGHDKTIDLVDLSRYVNEVISSPAEFMPRIEEEIA